MKVRIGVSLGPAATPQGLADGVDLLEKAGIVRPHIRDFYPQVLHFLVESNWQPAVQAQIS